MNYSTYRFTLDIHHTKSQISIPIPHMDTAVQFFINLTDGGKPYKMEEGCTAKLFGKKADGTSLVDDCDIIDNGTRIHYKFNMQTSSALGVCECEIRLYGKTELNLTTPSFDILFVPRVLKDDEIIESEVEKSAIDNLFLSENERVLAEEARDTAEQERIANENARIEAEVARESAEEIRKQNELEREENFKKFDNRLNRLENPLKGLVYDGTLSLEGVTVDEVTLLIIDGEVEGACLKIDGFVATDALNALDKETDALGSNISELASNTAKAFSDTNKQIAALDVKISELSETMNDKVSKLGETLDDKISKLGEAYVTVEEETLIIFIPKLV